MCNTLYTYFTDVVIRNRLKFSFPTPFEKEVGKESKKTEYEKGFNNFYIIINELYKF